MNAPLLPFALSLSKGTSATPPMGFDKLSPNGGKQ